MVLTHSLTRTVHALGLFFTELQHDFSERLAHASDYSQILKEKLQSWEESSHVFKEFKSCCAQMPKELRKRQFILQTLHEIENCEKRLKNFFHESKTFSLNEWQETSIYIKNAHDKLIQLQNEPLVQKFLRGETILSSKNNIQWARKIGHACFGVSFLYLFVYSGLPKAFIWTLTSLYILWAFSLEIARHRNPKVNEWVCRYFKPVMRESEKNRINSAIFYTISLLVVYFLFPLPVTILTLLFLAIGDPVAGVIGVYFGKVKIASHASLEGTLAGFVVCTLLSFLYAGFLFDVTLSGYSLIYFSLISGAIGATAELTFPKLDDNLVIPLISAPLLWILMHLFHLL